MNMSMDFAELHAVSNFSFLRGASHPEELVREASALGYRAIAITDECSVAGVVRAHQEARERDIKLIVGSEFRVEDEEGGEPVHLVVLAPDRSAYGQLSTLITVARRRAPKGEYALELSDLKRVQDCLSIWIPDREPIVVNLRKGQKIKSLLPNLWLCLELFSECDDVLKTTRSSIFRCVSTCR